MVAIHEDEISLFHSTVEKFLIAESRDARPNAAPQLSIKDSVGNAPTQRDWEGCLNISNAHGLICQICLNYLTLSNFAIPSEGVDWYGNYDSHDDDDVDDDEKSNGRSIELVDCNGQTTSLKAFVEVSLKKYTFLDYAALNWAYHYRQQDQRHRSILQVDVELMCNPSSVFFLNWASTFSFQGRVAFVLGCDGLAIASYFGLADLVEKYLRLVDDIDAYQPLYGAFNRKYTALRIAIEGRFPDAVRVLLKRGSNSFSREEYGGSPLREALQPDFLTPLSDALAILQMLFDSGLEINIEIVNGHTPLYYASLLSLEDIVGFLIERGADLEAQTGDLDWTPLQGPILFGHECQTATLLKYGADLARAKPKDTPFGKTGKFSSAVIYWC